MLPIAETARGLKPRAFGDSVATAQLRIQNGRPLGRPFFYVGAVVWSAKALA